jgi:hypothetical protein
MLSAEAVDFATRIAAGIGSGGVMLLLVILYIVNKERMTAQQQLLNLAVKGVEVMTGATSAINAVSKTVDELKREVAALRRPRGKR